MPAEETPNIDSQIEPALKETASDEGSQLEQAILREPGQPEVPVEVVDRIPVEGATGHIVRVRGPTFEYTVPSTQVEPVPEPKSPADTSTPPASLETSHEKSPPTSITEVHQAVPQTTRIEVRHEQPATDNVGKTKDEAIVASDSEATPETAAALSPSLQRLSEALAKSENKQAEIQQKLEHAKQSAIQAINNEDFQKAVKLADEASNRKASLRKAKKQAARQRKQLSFYQDALKPDNILDLKGKFDNQLQKEKDRRRKLQDYESLDPFAAMLKGHLINEYLQTGVEDGKQRSIPKKLTEEISVLMGSNYSELEAGLASAPSESQPNAGLVPDAEPNSDDDTVSNFHESPALQPSAEAVTVEQSPTVTEQLDTTAAGQEETGIPIPEIDRMIAENRSRNISALENLERKRGRSFGSAKLRSYYKTATGSVNGFWDYYKSLKEADRHKGPKEMLVLTLGMMSYVAYLSVLPGLVGNVAYKIHKKGINNDTEEVISGSTDANPELRTEEDFTG